jgi:hypothetical protein
MTRWLIATFACCLIALPVQADPPAAAANEPAALGALRAARSKGKKPGAPTPHDDATLAHPDDGAKHAALVAMHAAARRAKRDQARRQRHTELRAKLKGRAVPPSVRIELRTHARRISRLQRIRVLAGEDAALIVRVDGLIARENQRHERRLATLIAQAAKPDDDREQDDEVEE